MGDTMYPSQNPYYDETIDGNDAFPQQIVSSTPPAAGGGYNQVDPGCVSAWDIQRFERDVDGSSPATIDPALLTQYSMWCPPAIASSPSADSVPTPSASVWSGVASNACSPLTSPEAVDAHDFEDALQTIPFPKWMHLLLANGLTAPAAIYPGTVSQSSDLIRPNVPSPAYLFPLLPGEAGYTQSPPQYPSVDVAGTYGQGIGMVVNSVDRAAHVRQPGPGSLLEPRACTVILDEAKAGGKGRPCPTCKKVFKRPSNLVEHIKKKHNGERPYRCPVEGCPKATKGYSRNHDLNHHLVTKHKMEPRSLKRSRPSGVGEGITSKSS
ncbi:hypothetical protein C8Q78DRAFT_997285 [Trametes maxima]|nr:hypothetical protein C8Q78DRAFT_997285 [Trametes maxima]